MFVASRWLLPHVDSEDLSCGSAHLWFIYEGKRGWKCHICFLKVTVWKWHTSPLLSLHWWELITWSYVDSREARSKTLNHYLKQLCMKGKWLFGRQLTALSQADLTAFLLLRNIQAFLDLFASHFPWMLPPILVTHHSLNTSFIHLPLNLCPGSSLYPEFLLHFSSLLDELLFIPQKPN